MQVNNKTPLTPLEVGKNKIEGIAGTTQYLGDTVSILYVTDPEYRNNQWECIANINGVLCIVEVTPYWKAP